jgi:methylenetetrahydrofolate dehydrogenase (NADP+)/methenyltetrahydrofolate cyclohydrolase
VTIVNGKKIAREIIDDLKKLPKPQKKLAAILVGENPASISFLKQKEKAAKELEIEFHLLQLPESVSEKDLILEINKLNRDENVGGIIIQLPLPEKFNRENVISSLSSEKDIDALTSHAKVLALPIGVVQEILEVVGWSLSEKTVAVVGRGMLVGKPIAEWLVGKCKEIMFFNRQTGLSGIEKADLVVTGVGKAGLIKPEMLKTGAGVIDFGFDMKNGKISGDFDAYECQASGVKCQVSFYTPTPGGTGPILVAEIFKNFYRLIS